MIYEILEFLLGLAIAPMGLAVHFPIETGLTLTLGGLIFLAWFVPRTRSVLMTHARWVERVATSANARLFYLSLVLLYVMSLRMQPPIP